MIIHKSFYFVRHAETDFNKYGKISGKSNDIPINEDGVKQATTAARLFSKTTKVDVCVASPMLRTKQTAEIFSQHLNVPIIYHAGLKETNWGVLEGIPRAEVMDQMALWVQGKDIEGAENIRDFYIRIKTTMNEILQKYDNVLIVSHGGFFGSLADIIGMGYTHGQNAVPYKFNPPQENSGSWVLEGLM